MESAGTYPDTYSNSKPDSDTGAIGNANPAAVNTDADTVAADTYSYVDPDSDTYVDTYSDSGS